MDWTRQIDGYCERVDPIFWAEPINAFSNVAFLLAAFIMWRRVGAAQLPIASALVVILGMIGVGSYLFHTYAQVWSAFADSGFIALFAVIFVFAVNRDFLGLKGWRAFAATALFIPYVTITVPIFERLPFFNISSGYWPLPVLMVIYGVALRRRASATGRGLLLAAALVTVSLIFRSLDAPLCAVVPFGTHFIWHLLNAVLLAWMIEVYLRHMRGPLAAALRAR
ncbi:hypothetical protein G5B39_11310 [Rhodobacteraceae bacterium SC52]|nr:hypothetical protein G5B39_11310 [Rhodobacteraceae bacterium SC52]